MVRQNHHRQRLSVGTHHAVLGLTVLRGSRPRQHPLGPVLPMPVGSPPMLDPKERRSWCRGRTRPTRPTAADTTGSQDDVTHAVGEGVHPDRGVTTGPRPQPRLSRTSTPRPPTPHRERDVVGVTPAEVGLEGRRPRRPLLPGTGAHGRSVPLHPSTGTDPARTLRNDDLRTRTTGPVHRLLRTHDCLLDSGFYWDLHRSPEKLEMDWDRLEVAKTLS